MHVALSFWEGATTFTPVIKSISHPRKVLPITHIGFVINPVQGLTPEMVCNMKYLSVLEWETKHDDWESNYTVRWPPFFSIS